jgi:ubiquinone/menaquinone biosynthesis C-methylase UbiE
MLSLESNELGDNQMAGYDERNEDLEKAHGVRQEDWDNLLEIVNPREGEAILDLMGGPGAVAKQIYRVAEQSGKYVSLSIMDAYEAQMGGAPENIKKIRGDVKDIPLPDEIIDSVVIKMGLHELQLEDQDIAASEIYRILKPQGKFVNWMSNLRDKRQQEVFQWLFREKDRIAGLDELVKNRYFPTVKETTNYLKGAGFKEVNVSYENNEFCQTRGWFNGDFGGDNAKLGEFHSSIRSRWNDLVETIGAEDRGDNILIRFPICILEAVKPARQYGNYLLDSHTRGI